MTPILGELYARTSSAIDPKKFPDEEFELLSVPSHDRGVPDREFGRDIGSSKVPVEPGDVLICKIVPHIRRVWVVPPKGALRQIASGEWIVLRGEQFDPSYLRHFLLSDKFHANFMATVAGVGGSLMRARPAHARSIEVPLPPLPEQRRIASILDQADALRFDARRSRQMLEVTREFSFLEQIGSFESASGVSVQKLGAVATIGSGSTPDRGRSDFFGGTIPWVKTTEVRGSVIGDTGERVTEAGRAAARLRVFPKGSIVVAMYGQGKTRGQVATLGLDAAVNQACAVIAPGGNLDSEYLFEHLKMSYERLRSKARGGNQANLNLGLVADLDVIVPELRIQKAFVAQNRKLTELASILEQRLLVLDELFASLQHRAFAGGL